MSASGRDIRGAIVVGGAGFYGSWLVDLLRDEGIQTTVVDTRAPVDDAWTIAADVHDIDLRAVVDEHDPDVVFQLAGTGLVPASIERPLADLMRNASTTVTVLEAARHARRPPVVAYVSSAAVYGNGVRFPMDENHPLAPLSPYGISKLAAESYVSLYARMHGVPAFSVRPFSIYGPRQRKLVVYDLMRRAMAGEDPLVVAGHPDVTRDFVFVGDAAGALLTLARNAVATGEAYNIACGRAIRLGDLAEALVAAVGTGNEVTFTGVVRPGDPDRWDGDTTLAYSLGVSFDTPLHKGLALTATWLRSEAQS